MVRRSARGGKTAAPATVVFHDDGAAETAALSGDSGATAVAAAVVPASTPAHARGATKRVLAADSENVNPQVRGTAPPSAAKRVAAPALATAPNDAAKSPEVVTQDAPSSAGAGAEPVVTAPEEAARASQQQQPQEQQQQLTAEEAELVLRITRDYEQLQAQYTALEEQTATLRSHNRELSGTLRAELKRVHSQWQTTLDSSLAGRQRQIEALQAELARVQETNRLLQRDGPDPQLARDHVALKDALMDAQAGITVFEALTGLRVSPQRGGRVFCVGTGTAGAIEFELRIAGGELEYIPVHVMCSNLPSFMLAPEGIVFPNSGGPVFLHKMLAALNDIASDAADAQADA